MERLGEREKAILPLPCTNGFDDWTIKQWFAKINEELDELKESILKYNALDDIARTAKFTSNAVLEAADVETVITSMLDAMGFNESERQGAQDAVNKKNKERGRL